MKKILISILSVILICIFSISSHAGNLGIEFGGIYYSDQDSSVKGLGLEAQSDIGGVFGVAYRCEHDVKLNIFYEKVKRRIELESPIGSEWYFSDYTTERIMLSAVKNFPLCEKTKFYFGGGAGYSFNHLTDGPTISNINNNGGNVGLSIKNSVSYEIDAGITYEITENFDFNVSGKYIFDNAKATITTRNESVEGRTNFDTLAFMLSLTYWI